MRGEWKSVIVFQIDKIKGWPRLCKCHGQRVLTMEQSYGFHILKLLSLGTAFRTSYSGAVHCVLLKVCRFNKGLNA